MFDWGGVRCGCGSLTCGTVGVESSAVFITAGKLPEESEARPRGRGTRRRRRGHAGRGTFCDAAMDSAAHCSLLIFSLTVHLSLSSARSY
jgi:hypothetical protein